MEAVKTTLIIMPGSPALVGELAPLDTAGAHLLGRMRDLFDDHLDTTDTPVDLVGSRAAGWHTAHTGSFRAWGAPQVQVGGGNHLPELVQRYALGRFADRVRGVRDNLASISTDALTVVAVDGATGLTQRAPSSLVDGAAEIDGWCRALLGGQRPGARTEQELVDAAVREPQLWLELADLADRVDTADLIAADTSHGVGRYVAVWTVTR
ncbi:hypothetical protein HMPREF0290_1872 [Corynebacterium efficiens YS-314]|uniref:hypothetical protein n=1 Tax=Corynebacterium efficiens TaxID=152794 RepID=UPI0001B86C91|nr:hypothetical protein [Corynebacterium efficiens]EEW49494.1 hypothetical protein HMPREF0290_1872 [Corynebacterium efficiens YS-314]